MKKEEIKMSLFLDGMFLYIQKPKDFTHQTKETNKKKQ